MKENESFISEDKNNIDESLNIPTFSFTSTLKYKKKKIKPNKKNENEYEDLSILKINNNNENPKENINNEEYSDIESVNKIMTFNKNILFDEDQKLEKFGIKLGRKKKNSSEAGKHNKYSGDNLIRKCKGIILHNLYILINHIIYENYKDDEDYDKKKKKIIKNQSKSNYKFRC